MSLFDFLKPQRSFETQVSKLTGLSISQKGKSRIIEFADSTTAETIKALLEILRINKIAFSLYDPLFPSPSDPGAYIDYSQEQNEIKNSWSMTLGNHGWTGGIYTIEEMNIAIQISNLTRQKLTSAIKIDDVKIFSHYDKKSLEYNRNQNALIFGLHNTIEKIQPDFLIFGVFKSESWSPYNIYKLTKDKLFVDSSGIWHSERHTKNGYKFDGNELTQDKFEIAEKLLLDIPVDLLKQRWSGFYTTGNKSENQLLLEFANAEFHRSISIDSYEIETENLPEQVKNFRKTVENILLQLSE